MCREACGQVRLAPRLCGDRAWWRVLLSTLCQTGGRGPQRRSPAQSHPGRVPQNQGWALAGDPEPDPWAPRWGWG